MVTARQSEFGWEEAQMTVLGGVSCAVLPSQIWGGQCSQLALQPRTICVFPLIVIIWKIAIREERSYLAYPTGELRVSA